MQFVPTGHEVGEAQPATEQSSGLHPEPIAHNCGEMEEHLLTAEDGLDNDPVLKKERRENV